MSLDERLLRLALYCAGEERDARREGKPPGVQAWNSELIRALELELAASASGQPAADRMSSFSHEQDDDWIGTLAAARILQWDERRTRRHAADLEGRKVAGKWVFRAKAVTAYAEGLTHARLVS
jgi:hypothetical protein